MRPARSVETVLFSALPLLCATAAFAQSSHFQYADPLVPGVGWSVRGLGDVNGDGTGDVATASYRLDCGFGGCGAAPSKLAVLSGLDGTLLYDLVPPTPDGTGFALDVVGDIDLDGRPDFVIGAPDSGGPLQPRGEVRVHSGANGALLFRVAGPAQNSGFGISVAGVGDVDGDGVPDFAGAWYQAVHVYSGANGVQLHAFPATVPNPWRATVAGYGDLDNDGRADVLVGFTESGPGASGSVELLSGQTGGLLRSFSAPGMEPSFGWSIDTLGDLDGDGRPEVIIGAPQVDFAAIPSGPGFAAVYSSTGALLRQLNGSQLGGHFGISVGGGGNVDGDGLPDYAVAKSCEPGVSGCSREVSVYAGASGQLLHTLGALETGLEGLSLDFVGDLDGDGRSELAVGSACSEPWSQCGTVDVLSFGTAAPVSYCTSGTSSHGCLPSIGATGVPSASAVAGFTLTVTSVEGQRQGLVFYGVSGRAALPWGSGGSSFLCVKAPTQRTGIQSSGGTVTACDGALSIDWLAFVATTPAALGTPFGPGDLVQAQAWYRDPPSVKTTSLSDALEFTLAP